jgi:TP901 family phage tail tape measure protein
MANGMNISFTISAVDDFSATMANLQSQTQKAFDSIGTVGKTMTIAGAAIAGGLGIAVKTSMDFEAQISRVGAIAGATGTDLDALRESAMKLGASSSKSATEVAQGQEALAALGFTTKDIIGAMPGVISAAEASGSDMAQTAEVMASTMNIFGLSAGKATKVADILAKTANISAADLTDMQYAIKYAGPPAAALGVSLEDLSASIGIMTNAGMEGEQAGTTLRSALIILLNPSEENSKLMGKLGIAVADAKGNFVGLPNLIGNISDSMKGQTDTQKQLH